MFCDCVLCCCSDLCPQSLAVCGSKRCRSGDDPAWHASAVELLYVVRTRIEIISELFPPKELT